MGETERKYATPKEFFDDVVDELRTVGSEVSLYDVHEDSAMAKVYNERWSGNVIMGYAPFGVGVRAQFEGRGLVDQVLWDLISAKMKTSYNISPEDMDKADNSPEGIVDSMNLVLHYSLCIKDASSYESFSREASDLEEKIKKDFSWTVNRFLDR